MSDPALAPEAVAASLSAWRILDVRSADAFVAGRAVGAVRVPIEAWERAAKTASGALGNRAFWTDAIEALGIDGATPVAVLDDGRMTEAARVWFILQHFGVPAAVIDGGWPLLQPMLREAVEVGPASPPPRASLATSAAPGRVALVERPALRDALNGDAAPRIFDGRTAAEYAGTDRRANARGGHLPGARHVAHAALLGADGRLQSPAALRSLLAAAGLRPGEPVVTHCDGGGRASLAALAAVRAGFGEVGVYYLSFADWAADPSCPIER